MASLFDREIFKGVVGNLYFWIFLAIGGGMIAFFNSLLAADTGLSYYQVGLVFAATFALIGLGSFGLVAAYKARNKNRPEEDSGRGNVVHNEANNKNVFKPKVKVKVSDSGTQTQKQKAVEPPRNKPSFECRGTRFVKWAIDTRTNELIKEDYTGSEDELMDCIGLLDTALARFYYRPDEGVDPSLYVTAHVAVYDSENKLLKEIFETVWADSENSESMDFYTARAHELIVALLPRTDAVGIFAYEHAEEVIQTYMGRDIVFKPNVHAFEGKDFRIRVELIAKRLNEFRAQQPFWFRLTLDPKPEFVEMKLTPPLSS
jgi:hypothetical protein